jgi:hypothetical protein
VSDAHHSSTGVVAPGKPHLVSAYSDGGHEVDNLPATQLIALVVGMAALIVLTGVGVYQYYNLSVSADAAASASVASARISTAKAARSAVAESWAETDADKGTWRMPASEGAKRVVANPALLRAAAPPDGFVHPDDVKKEGAAATPEPAPEPAAVVPAEVVPAEVVPTEAVPAEVVPANPDDAPPAEDTAPAPAEGDAP